MQRHILHFAVDQDGDVSGGVKAVARDLHRPLRLIALPRVVRRLRAVLRQAGFTVQPDGEKGQGVHANGQYKQEDQKFFHCLHLFLSFC